MCTILFWYDMMIEFHVFHNVYTTFLGSASPRPNSPQWARPAILPRLHDHIQTRHGR